MALLLAVGVYVLLLVFSPVLPHLKSADAEHKPQLSIDENHLYIPLISVNVAILEGRRLSARKGCLAPQAGQLQSRKGWISQLISAGSGGGFDGIRLGDQCVPDHHDSYEHMGYPRIGAGVSEAEEPGREC